MSKLFWIDMEMTGLDVNTCGIMEIACLVTDERLHIIDRFHAVVRTSQKALDAMDEWNTRTHGGSGLTKEVLRGKFLQEVETDLRTFADKHFRDKQIILCGSSVNQDKIFLEKHMPAFAQKLHYRIIDISSWKAIFQNFLDLRFKRGENHRAMDDIEESLRELKLYLTYIDPDKLPAIKDLHL